MQEAEEYIVDLRNGYWNEDNKLENQINEKLQNSAILELKFQYSLWKKDYKSAFDYACSIVGTLNAPALNGYKSFWNYITGCMAYYLFQSGQIEYKKSGIQYLSDALKENISIRCCLDCRKNCSLLRAKMLKKQIFSLIVLNGIRKSFYINTNLTKNGEKNQKYFK